MANKIILVTGANGFLGKNLISRLKDFEDFTVLTFCRHDQPEILKGHLLKADWIFHIAGVNRPKNEKEFEAVNTGLTGTITEFLMENGCSTPIVFASSTQAAQDNPYGRSKREAENLLTNYEKRTTARVFSFRLPSIFGKWSKPNYNSVVSTFCHNIANNLEIQLNDPKKKLILSYVDHIIDPWINLLTEKKTTTDVPVASPIKTFEITLGSLSKKISEFKSMRKNLFIPDLNDELTKCLYSTYLSYLNENDFAYNLDPKTDERGDLTELFKSNSFGQVFISTTKAGIERGNHYHHSKVEKFCVIKGKGLIKFRHILNEKVISYEVSGSNIQIVDIPPGYTHSITNISDKEMITLFWANEPFDFQKPDTRYYKVET